MRVLISILLLSITFSLQAQTNMAVSFGDINGLQYGSLGIMDANNNYVMSGKKFIYAPNANGDRPHMTKFDANFVKQWSFYFDVYSIVASTLIELRNGDYLATYSTGVSAHIVRVNQAGAIVWYRGYSNISNLESSYEDANEDIYIGGGRLENQIVQKLSKNGQILWTKSLDAGTNYHFARGIQESADGHILVNGSGTFVNNAVYNKITLSKLTKSGQMVWSKKYESPTTSLMSNDCVISSEDNSVIMAGYTGILNNASSFDGLIFKVDANGDYVKNKRLGYIHRDQYYDIVEVKGNGQSQTQFALAGYCKPVAVCGGNALFTLIDNDLDTVVNKVYGTPAGNGADFRSLHYGAQTGLRAYGTGSLFSSSNTGEYQCLHLDANLNLPCNLYAQSLALDTVEVIQTSGISITDYTPMVDSVVPAVYTDTLTAYNSCTTQPLSVRNINLAEQVTVYPNPAMELISINAPQSMQQINLYSMHGKLVRSENVTGDRVQFNLKEMPSGTYFLNINLKNGQRIMKKLSVQ